MPQNSQVTGELNDPSRSFILMMIEITPEQWMDEALCRGADPGEFFPSDGVGVDMAQRVCSPCPVRAECLEFALANRIEHGVWGGESERERRRILRRRKIGVTAKPQADSAPVQSHESDPPVTPATSGAF